MPEAMNEKVAARLEEVGKLLVAQGANPFRARAYRRAAETVRALEEPVAERLAREGLEGLERLPAIGPSIARSIQDMLVLGALPMLDRLRGESDPVRLLGSVPSVGPKLAARLHEELGLDTLEDLESAAHDGRLAALPGIGEKRLTAIRDSLAQRLSRVRSALAGRRREPRGDEPPVSELLDVDREYREGAAAGRLRRIAPRRMNPAGKAWLPILHARRGRRHYTALFSNTPNAHRLGRTRDWVVLYHDQGDGERPATVVTAEAGPLRGRRVVRGREVETAAWYQEREAQPQNQGAQPQKPEGRRQKPKAQHAGNGERRAHGTGHAVRP